MFPGRCNLGRCGGRSCPQPWSVAHRTPPTGTNVSLPIDYTYKLMMNSFALINSICLIFLICSCKEKNQETAESKIQHHTSEDSITCVYYKSDRKPSETFPFNEADKIVIYSYKSRDSASLGEKLIVHGKFTLKNFKETVVLNQLQKDSLFSLLYNYKTRYDDCSGITASACYVPRHSIVFYKDKRAIAFLELCLECGQENANNTDFGNFCYGKMDLFEKYFKSIGIKEGLPNEMLQKLRDQKRIKDSLSNVTKYKHTSK